MMTQLELGLLDWIQQALGSGTMDTFMSAVTHLGDAGAVWILSAVALLIYPKTRRLGAAMAAALVLEVLVCNCLLKPLVDRPRPFEVNTAVSLLISRPTDGSFPSGHTGASFAAIAVLFRGRSRWRYPALALGLLIAFSRLYLYVHFPTDVLAGALIGAALGCLAWRLTVRVCDRRGWLMAARH